MSNFQILGPNKDWEPDQQQSELAEKVQGYYEEIGALFNDTKTTLILVFEQRFTSSPAGTSGGRIQMYLEAPNGDKTGRGPRTYLDRHTPPAFYKFLLAHEVGHNYYCPEHIVPYLSAMELYRTRSPVYRDSSNQRYKTVAEPNEIADILINTSIMRDPDVKKFTGFTGKELMRENIKQFSIGHIDFETINSVNIDEQGYWRSWEYYFYKDAATPHPHQPELAPLFEKYLAHGREPIPGWIDEFYEIWFELHEKYGFLPQGSSRMGSAYRYSRWYGRRNESSRRSI